MSNHVRSREELAAALAEQRGFLRQSSAAYDSGNTAEAKRLANTVYVMMHEGTGRTKSLLGQLNLRDTLKLRTTAAQIPVESLPKTALAFMSAKRIDTVLFHPRFAHPQFREEGRYIAASEWWDEPVYQALGEPEPRRIWGNGKTISRKNLVFHMRSQDGGAHFDAELKNETYIDLALKAGTGIEIKNDDGTYTPVPFPHLATMRQIAWELEQSLIAIPGGPEIPPPAAWPSPDVPAESDQSATESAQRGATVSVESALARQQARFARRFPSNPPAASSGYPEWKLTTRP